MFLTEASHSPYYSLPTRTSLIRLIDQIQTLTLYIIHLPLYIIVTAVTLFLHHKFNPLFTRPLLCLLVYKARNGMAPDYIQDLCVPVSTVSTRSALRSAARRESSIQRRRSCGVEQFAAGHSYCINTLFFQKSAQDSSIFSFISVTGIYLISKSVCCMAPL